MAGFGKSLLGAITGAAEGYGDYLQMEGKQRMVQEQEERQSQRAIALEQFRANIQGERDERQNQNRRGEIVLSGLVNRENNQIELQGRASAAAADDARGLAVWKEKNKIENAQRLKELTIQLGNDKAKIAYEKEMSARFAADKDGFSKVGEEIDADTGEKVLFFADKQGNTKTYGTGIVAKEKAAYDPLGLGGDTTADKPADKPKKAPAAGWRNQPAAAAGAGAGTRSKVDIGIDQLLTSYGGATPERYPGLFRNGKKIPIEEAKAMIRRAVGS